MCCHTAFLKDLKCWPKEKRHWIGTNSCLAVKVKGPVRRELTRAHQREQKRRKIDRCQEEAGLRVTQKMVLIPPSIPAAFLLFEVTSGLNFPPWVEQKGSLLGGWKEARGPALPHSVNSTVDPWVIKPRSELLSRPPIQCSWWWPLEWRRCLDSVRHSETHASE